MDSSGIRRNLLVTSWLSSRIGELNQTFWRHIGSSQTLLISPDLCPVTLKKRRDFNFLSAELTARYLIGADSPFKLQVLYNSKIVSVHNVGGSSWQEELRERRGLGDTPPPPLVSSRGGEEEREVFIISLTMGFSG